MRTSVMGVLSASFTIAWRFRSTSRSVRRGRFPSSRASNQSVGSNELDQGETLPNTTQTLTKLSSPQDDNMTSGIIYEHLASSLTPLSIHVCMASPLMGVPLWVSLRYRTTSCTGPCQVGAHERSRGPAIQHEDHARNQGRR